MLVLAKSPFVLGLFHGPGTFLQDLSFWLSPGVPRKEFLDYAFLTVHCHPHSICPLPLCFSACPAGIKHRCGLNDNWLCLIGYLPSLAHLANPHYQPSLPDRTCIVLEEGVGPGTKSVGGPQSRCKVSASFFSQISTQVVRFTPIL